MPYKEVSSERAKETARLRKQKQRARDMSRPVTPSVTPKVEVLTRLRQLIQPVEVKKKPIVPLYNASVHKAGDRVRVFDGHRLVEMVIPELDADGQPVPQGASSTSLSSTFNLMKPTFNPDPKPAKKPRKSFRRRI